jgi:hypothetical protein
MYWNYLERHPNHIPLPPNAEQEARDALAWFHLGTDLSFRSYFWDLIPYKTTSGQDLVAPYLFRNRNVRTYFAQYPESIVSRTAAAWLQFPTVLSADLGDDSPGRTVFFSWILRVICTFSAWPPPHT